jgi:hypothetical protein
MFIAIVLVVHLTLAAAVSVGFIYRYILTFKNKNYPRTGRTALFGGSIGLVISGVLLAGIAKLPITSLCLESLGIIVALLVMEFGLQRLSGRLATEKNRLDKQ